MVAPGDYLAIGATGSEVEVAIDARAILQQEGVSARVVSIPSFELFFERPESVARRHPSTSATTRGCGGRKPVRLVHIGVGVRGHGSLRRPGPGPRSVPAVWDYP